MRSARGSFWIFYAAFSSFPPKNTNTKTSTMMPPSQPPAVASPPPCPPRHLDGNQIGFLQQQGFSSGKKKDAEDSE
jgi:hypothetical protein